ncbi:MAG: ribosomal L7Ae/L30e/S12e/Gadd45 family protein [Oscillospiraceae bacterium]|jgi:ribosomal protein L7Ae-like RNA K-turn-binding protein|nr:ribosomal L7Ae/L30e/S12e/Gadd45 family protein [Oscillospiraceae bacterium]
MTDERVWGLLGLCARSGKLVSGESACEQALRAGGAALVLIDAGASPNTRKKFSDACAYRQVPLCPLDADRLGQAIGKPGRMTVAVGQSSLAKQLTVLLLPDQS